ncbi:MAG: protein-L-isoaspartate O-methyltransferase [Gammaproteobacteria bacterium]|nr:protein-L-isoaspartate O-methyltransferase [Gammaproteobacteria bacterium]
MTMNAIEQARRQMVEQQVRAWEVLDDRVLGVMAQVRRELFVPATYRGMAFADSDIPLGHGQKMLAPKVDGRILQALAPLEGEEILDVGTGSGFLAACLARLSGVVRSLEIVPELAERAQENVRASGVAGVHIEVFDAMTLSETDRYDVIALTGSLPVYDPRFERALRLGGRLFVICGEAPAMQATLIRRVGDHEWIRESLFETVVEPLRNAPRPSPFVF